MLLRRMMEHVRTQNWLAVFLDFIIVVVGVFIGIQVANWNNVRSDRAYERDILYRLHNEILTLETGREVPGLVQHNKALREFLPRLKAGLEDTEVDDLTCRGIIRSHVLNGPPDSLPALDELISSGRMKTLRNTDIRSFGSSFLQKREFGRELITEFDNDLRDLGREFPELMHIQIANDPETEQGSSQDFTCDLVGMRNNTAFQTALINNVDRFNGIMSYHFDFVGADLDALHQAVDQELRIQHIADDDTQEERL
ncbi:hypothetical protein FF098_009720 [Parvularcula flava]|uniref:Uncharacterized protein n=1 Tax=Aquisalinus luteolus TaxID=1566827 RepID=A0A8J3ER81_9PROT|nr:hypothetical protein [Aquisalinus luteolus]NHK28180.1 hypothetical protein [Aquisalinus luteolus]GGH97705.1 hypothetical protein GCM10011355_19570 [Aquisalinus luteolus]